MSRLRMKPMLYSDPQKTRMSKCHQLCLFLAERLGKAYRENVLKIVNNKAIMPEHYYDKSDYRS